MSVSLGWSTYLYHDAMKLFSSEPPLLLVMECEVPEDPLAVGNLQNLADELSGPLSSIDSVIPQSQVFILHIKDMSRSPAFHKVLPAYDVLAFG